MKISKQGEEVQCLEEEEKIDYNNTANNQSRTCNTKAPTLNAKANRNHNSQNIRDSRIFIQS